MQLYNTVLYYLLGKIQSVMCFSPNLLFRYILKLQTLSVMTCVEGFPCISLFTQTNLLTQVQALGILKMPTLRQSILFKVMVMVSICLQMMVIYTLRLRKFLIIIPCIMLFKIRVLYQGIIHLVVSSSALTWFIRYTTYL